MFNKIKITFDKIVVRVIRMINMVYKLFRKVLMPMNAWFELLRVMLSSLFDIIRNPSFIMFSVIALGLGTMGIWIGFFPGSDV
ncbi:hypothetical protein, partial [Shewanella sairae]